MSTMRQQFHPSSAKNILRKQKSIDLNDKPSGDSKKTLRKQLSVDHVTSGIKHANPPPVSLNFNNFLWRNSTQSLHESNLKIVSTSAVKKRAQFATNSINTSVLSKQELLSDCCKTMKTAGEGSKTKVNINIFLSQEVNDDGVSDHDNSSSHVESQTFLNKISTNQFSNTAPKPIVESEVSSAASGRLSVSARRAQFQASRRIMSAPIRPMNLDDSKNKKKIRKKKVIRVNLTLNRDKEDFDDSPDELPDEVETKKANSQPFSSKAQTKAKPLATRSRSVLGCDQIGIETLVSMLSSGGSDSEKEEQPIVQPSPPKTETPRIRANMLRKSVSFQEDDSIPQPSLHKDLFGNRRSSNVQFAGRMRNTRSLFGSEISNLYLPNNDEKSPENKNENDLNSYNKPSEGEEGAAKPKTKKGSEGNSNDKKTQDNQTPKEQECWRLYEKMKKTGLNVSYDTILRGILKPSELRLLEKQKKYLGDIDEKADSSEAQLEPQAVN